MPRSFLVKQKIYLEYSQAEEGTSESFTMQAKSGKGLVCIKFILRIEIFPLNCSLLYKKPRMKPEN